jgi:hypothetical protein
VLYALFKKNNTWGLQFGTAQFTNLSRLSYQRIFELEVSDYRLLRIIQEDADHSARAV